MGRPDDERTPRRRRKTLDRAARAPRASEEYRGPRTTWVQIDADGREWVHYPTRVVLPPRA